MSDKTNPQKGASPQSQETFYEAEDVFWDAVHRNRKCDGLKFRRQQVIAGYVADFYCEAAKLVIEIDGNVHEKEDVRENDEKKNAAHKEHGLYTLRFQSGCI